jgi:hypothetical protein
MVQVQVRASVPADRDLLRNLASEIKNDMQTVLVCRSLVKTYAVRHYT